MIRQLVLPAMLALALCACSSRQAAAPPSSATSASSHASNSTQGSASGTASSAGASSGENTTASRTSGASAATSSSAAAADSPLALPTSEEWHPGVNYSVISPAQPTNAPAGKVQVMEAFWLACPHCYALEPYILGWLKNKPSYVQFVRVPVMWGPVQRAHARLFYTLEALGRNDLVEKAFHYIHGLEAQTHSESIMVGSDKANTLRMQEAFAKKNGVSPAAFAQAYNSFDVNTHLQQAQEINQIYEINSVPTIIVDGRYRTNVVKAGSEKRLIALINFLTKWDHDHQNAS